MALAPSLASPTLRIGRVEAPVTQWRQAAERRLCAKSFPDFLRFLRIPDEMRGLIPYEVWPHLDDMAHRWQAGDSEVVLKARQLGVSWLLAAYMLWYTLYHDARSVCAISKSQIDSDELLHKVMQLWEYCPEHLRLPARRTNTRHVVWVNGSRVVSFPSTKNAGRGFTWSLVVIDEGHFHPYASTNYRAYRPTLDGGGQLLMVSTANGTTGLFHDLWQSSAGNKTPYRAVFIPWWARPSRQAPRTDSDGNYLDAEGYIVDVVEQAERIASRAWLEHERSAFEGMPSEFRAEFPASAAEAWVAQTGLVFGMDEEDGQLIFNPEQHPRGNLAPDPCRFAACRWKYAGVDWGGGDPTAVGIWGVTSSGRIHQFAELHRTGPTTIQDIAAFLDDWAEPADWDAILCGADESVSIATLAGLGYPAEAANTNRREGLNIYAALLKQRRVTHNPDTCPWAVREYDSYRWAEKRDQSTKSMFATSTPFDHHGDHKDEARYVLAEIHAVEMSARDYDQPAFSEVRWR